MRTRPDSWAATGFRVEIDTFPSAEVACNVGFLQQRIDAFARYTGISAAGAAIEAAKVPDAGRGCVAVIKRLFKVDVRFVGSRGLAADFAFDRIYA